jgi:hypothetical protein
MGAAEQVVQCNGGIPQKMQHVRLRRIWVLEKNIPHQTTLPCGFPPGKKHFLYLYSVNDSGYNAGLSAWMSSGPATAWVYQTRLIQLCIQRYKHLNRTQDERTYVCS